MRSKENLIGHKFHKLKVLELIGVFNVEKDPLKVPRYRRFWKCKCDCGNVMTIDTGRIKAKALKSCGCIKGYKDHTSAPINALLQQYKYKSKKSKRPSRKFNLTKKHFTYLISLPCFYCGAFPSSLAHNSKRLHKSDFLYNGIDRIDNNIGYTRSNCVTCCEQCNRSKLDYSKEDFLQWIKRIYKHLRKNNAI